MDDLTDELKLLRSRLSEAESTLGLEALRERLAKLEESHGAGLWDDPTRHAW
ncbi:MAG: hypothetical protein ACRD0Q_08970 [Acidimicrobiales bacterium]